jgi:hypothetical protein
VSFNRVFQLNLSLTFINAIRIFTTCYIKVHLERWGRRLRLCFGCSFIGQGTCYTDWRHSLSYFFNLREHLYSVSKSGYYRFFDSLPNSLFTNILLFQALLLEAPTKC